MTYTMSLGPTQPNRHPLRHETDATWEVLVDFSDGREGSLGWLSVMYDPFTGVNPTWFLLQENGDPLIPKERYLTKKAALDAARQYLDVFLEA